ncbi:MAG: YfcE family phosphodiesterase [Halolamina sp.]|uniref:metallophosphoesterase family protein n=1 Tax=Halolamina sp. TaxID=1940283 RepID=UPI002FC3C967
MRLGVLSDIHGNRIALDAVLADMPPVEGLVCAGDVVGYNPWPQACVDSVRDHDMAMVLGNHDRAVAGALGWLGSLSTERRVADGRVKLVHGHPDDPDHYTHPDEFSAALLGDEELLVMGHTHHQYHERDDEGIVLNPGSVGQPRDGDPDATYAVVDAVVDAGLPERVGTRLREGR